MTGSCATSTFTEMQATRRTSPVLRFSTIVAGYLLLTPVVTSLNGLAMHQGGPSVIGPAFHATASLLILILAGVNPRIPKRWDVVALCFGAALTVVSVQIATGRTDARLADVGQLYKWFAPVLVYAVLFDWRLPVDGEAWKNLCRVFFFLPIIYAALNFLSLAVYLATGFEATLFDAQVKRFSGFAWAYNPTVNAMLLCAYANGRVHRTPMWQRIVALGGFGLLRSKTAVLYGLLFLWPYFATADKSTRRRRPAMALGLVLLPGLLWLGWRESGRAADLYGYSTSTGQATSTLTTFWDASVKASGRLELLEFYATDYWNWAPNEQLFGNGLNLDRRIESAAWSSTTAARNYANGETSKATKAPEFDLFGHLDLLGLVGTTPFFVLFYVYPFLSIRTLGFGLFYGCMTVLSVVAGHLTNNPQTGIFLVFFLLWNKSTATGERIV